jgi:hypothetical protein
VLQMVVGGGVFTKRGVSLRSKHIFPEKKVKQSSGDTEQNSQSMMSFWQQFTMAETTSIMTPQKTCDYANEFEILLILCQFCHTLRLAHGTQKRLHITLFIRFLYSDFSHI